jgi:membrane fusion protein, multidrug efflux system
MQFRLKLLSFCFLLTLIGCHKKAPTAKRPAPAVYVEKTALKDAPIYIDSFGLLKAKQSATLTSQVTGTLQKRLFTEGKVVEKGELLYVIDPAPYEAALHKAEANLQTQLAQLNYAQKVLERNRDLASKEYVSKLEFEKFEKDVQSAAAAVNLARAQIEEAEVNLNYCYITAPFRGTIGISQVDPGNLISAQQTQLTTLHELDQLKVDFSIPDRNVSSLIQHKTGKGFEITVSPRSEESLSRTGPLTIVDNGLDNKTGTLRLQGLIANADGAFWPGQFVDIHLILDRIPHALVIPTDAITSEPKGTYVYVVSEGMTIEKRKIEIIQRQAAFTIVKSGVHPGDLVVTDGQSNVVSGEQVRIVKKTPSLKGQ